MLYSLCYAQTRTLLFLIFLTYLIFTEFEPPSMFCHCKTRHTSLFLWRLVNKRILRWRIRKDSSLFPFFFFYFFIFSFFFHWVLGWSRHFFNFVVELPGWLPLQGYYQMILVFNGISVNLGEPDQHYLIHITAANLTSRSTYAFFNFDFGIYNFMENSFNIYSASYRIGTFIYW